MPSVHSSLSTRPPNLLFPTILRHVIKIFKKYGTKALGTYLLYILFKYRTTALGVRPRPELNSPRGIPLLGNTLQMLTRRREENYQIQTKFHQKYGRIYAMTVLGLGRVFNVSEPEAMDHVLRVNFWAYEKGAYFRTVLSPLVGEGIFGADGQHWRWQRKLASRIFTVQGFRDFTDSVFCKEADLVRDYLGKIADQGRAIDLQEVFYKFTLDSFGEIAFGESFGCLKDLEQEVEFASAFDRLNTSLSHRFGTPFWKFTQWWTGQQEQIERDAKTVYDFAYGVIQRRREQGFDREHKDLMQLFMEAEDEDGKPLSTAMMKDTLMNFVIAGRDTTAQALSWMFYLIHRSSARKEILEKLQQETDRILKGGYPTYETTKQQKYAEACLHETLRLYPSVPQNMKICVQDDVLPGGYKVYKGEKIAWSTWAMGRDTGIWGPDALEFKPERWLTGEKPSSSKFVSFHLGPRTCLGQQFATIEAITMLSLLLQRFTFELVDPHIEPAYIASLTLPMAKGLLIRCKHRVDKE